MPLNSKETIEKFGSVRLEEETLSDGSFVYNVIVGNVKFFADDRDHAYRFFEHLGTVCHETIE